jgi:hypothetical protein
VQPAQATENPVYALGNQGTVAAAKAMVLPEKLREHCIGRILELEDAGKCLGGKREGQCSSIRTRPYIPQGTPSFFCILRFQFRLDKNPGRVMRKKAEKEKRALSALFWLLDWLISAAYGGAQPCPLWQGPPTASPRFQVRGQRP